MPPDLRILDMILTVIKTGERLHYNTITKRVIKTFPNWETGKTPDASIRRTLNYNSDRHPENGEVYFHAEAEEGYYTPYDGRGLLPSASVRVRALIEFARHAGQEVSAAVLQRTRDFWPEAGVRQIHPLISGIYKPEHQEEALCIKMGIDSTYSDHLEFLTDGRWRLSYDQRGTDKSHSDNRSLQRCIELVTPVGVIQQVKPKLQGSTYLIIGLGMVRSYADGKFEIESALEEEVRRFAGLADPILQEELVINNGIADQFNLTGDREMREEKIQRPVRDEAFKRLIRKHYRYACAVCQAKFYLARKDKPALIEVHGAHIVPVEKGGTDDLRNGMALCRTHHWSLDAGLFTVNPDYQIKISPQIVNAEKNKFDLEVYSGIQINVPANVSFRPHPAALEWHNKNAFLT